MGFVCLEGNYSIVVPYRGSSTVKNLITDIQEGIRPEEFVDRRLKDINFPHREEGDVPCSVQIVSFNSGWSSKEDGIKFLRSHGYDPANVAELLALRSQYPEHVGLGYRVAALGSRWLDGRGNFYVPCLGHGCGPGLRVRILSGGWVSSWKFAVKKAESE